MYSPSPINRWNLLLSAMVAFLLASQAWSATSTQPAAHPGKMVTLKGSREPFKGYLVEPKGKGPFPAVVVIMEWWGLNDQIKGVADRLAKAGYVALVPDLYYGQVTADPEKAHELMRGLDQQEALTDLGSAMNYLHSLPAVGKSKIASLGFCMGGGLSLQLALSRPDLSGAVMFYGQPDTDPMALEKAACPVLGLFGAEDQGIPEAKIQAMAKELNEVGEGADIKIYPGAGHAFFNETRPSYNAAAAADAWTLTLTFLQARLKG
jgi:carboxymethylenebutenolidase